jgi:hypothetical protein
LAIVDDVAEEIAVPGPVPEPVAIASVLFDPAVAAINEGACPLFIMA